MTAAYFYRFDRQVSNLPKVADVLIAESGVKTYHSSSRVLCGHRGWPLSHFLWKSWQRGAEKNITYGFSHFHPRTNSVSSYPPNHYLQEGKLPFCSVSDIILGDR